MAKFKVTIRQVFKVFRNIDVEIEAEDLDSAIEAQASGAEDIPSHDDPRWVEEWDLQNEEVEAA